MLAADNSFALSNRLAPPMDRRQRGFWIALGCALVLHAALLVEANRNAPRRVGSAEGSDEAIAVEIVTEADLKSRETVAVPQSGAPPVPPPQPQTAPEPAPQPPPEPEAKAAEPAPTPPPAPQPKQEAEKPPSQFDLPDLADVAPLPEKTKPAEQEAKAEPAEKQSKPEPQKKKEQAKQQARLDPPASPRDAPQAAPNRGSSFSRPPGITQSGENDDFGRGVIRALRATMPPPAGIYGRVTVRLLLNENGDLSQVQVVESSGKPNLDQSVVFATKQSNFPLPPAGATVADRTFLISYVYR